MGGIPKPLCGMEDRETGAPDPSAMSGANGQIGDASYLGLCDFALSGLAARLSL
jgi:hypothetical protein